MVAVSNWRKPFFGQTMGGHFWHNHGSQMTGLNCFLFRLMQGKLVNKISRCWERGFFPGKKIDCIGKLDVALENCLLPDVYIVYYINIKTS